MGGVQEIMSGWRCSDVFGLDRSIAEKTRRKNGSVYLRM